MQNKVLKINKILTFITSLFFSTFDVNRKQHGRFRIKIQ